MGLVETIASRVAQRSGDAGLAYPIGNGNRSTSFVDWAHAKDPGYDPTKYGDYLATSNEVFAASMLRARQMVSLGSPRTFVGNDAEKTETPSSAAAKLLRYVNPFWTPLRLAMMDELSMCVQGQSFWAVEGAMDKNPTEVWWVSPKKMKPVPDDKNYLKGFLYFPDTGPPIGFGPDEVVWFRYPNPNDEFQPLNPLVAARLAADTGRDMVRANRNLFTDGLQMGGVIVPADKRLQFSSGQAKELEHALEERWTGAANRHRWAVLRFEAQFRAMNVTPKDAEFVAGLGLTTRQVWNAYGVPAPLLNDLEHATLANVREYERQLWTQALKPDSMLRASEIAEQFLPMFSRRPGPGKTPDHCEFDYGQVPALQQAQSDAWDRDRQAIEIGALTINEHRKARGLPPVAWGDVYWAPVNKSAVSSSSSKPEGDTSPPVDDEDAAEMMAQLEMARLEATGPLLSAPSSNGHKGTSRW